MTQQDSESKADDSPVLVKQKVPGQWVLSADELAMLVAVVAPGGIALGEPAVRTIVAKVNQSRFGEPPEVVRRHKDGRIAIRAQRDDGTLYWNVLNPKGEPSDIREWARIYPTSFLGNSNDWYNRVTETDFKGEC
ncbi:hypothetical protein [Mycobacteroides sp. PCS013]|uniref:hypothetical protein n=1 Tax=Mycobacteroides sp. PCS013 TaxID=3074106 RepID=UPI003C2B81DA